MIFNKEMTTREILEQLFDIYGIDDENTPLVINENDSETRKALKRAMNEQIFKKRQQDFLSSKTSLSDLATGHKQNFFKPILNNGAGEFDLKNILLPDVYSIKNKLKDALKLKDIHLPKELPKIPMEVPDFYVSLEMYDLPDNEIIETMKPRLAKIEGDYDHVYIDTRCFPSVGDGENLYDENGIDGKPFYDIDTHEPLTPEQKKDFKQKIVQERQRCFDIRAQYETEAERKKNLYNASYYEPIFGQYRLSQDYTAGRLQKGLEERIKTLRQHFKNNNVDYDKTPANIKMLYLDRYFNSGKLPFNHPGVLEKHRNKDWTSIPAIFRTNIVSQDRLDYQNELANQPTMVFKAHKR